MVGNEFIILKTDIEKESTIYLAFSMRTRLNCRQGEPSYHKSIPIISEKEIIELEYHHFAVPIVGIWM